MLYKVLLLVCSCPVLFQLCDAFEDTSAQITEILTNKSGIRDKDIVNIESDKGITPLFENTTTYILEIESADLTTEEYAVTEFKQAEAVTPVTETTEDESISNVICEKCVCVNHTVDCYNRELLSSFEITDWEGLESFKAIAIDLSNNPLTKFNRVSSLPTVQHLNLSNCGLVDIEYASFSYLLNLVTLDLSDNRLQTDSINRRVFVGIINSKLDRIVPFTKIQFLSLANNEIHSLTQDVFMFMNGLTSLDLSGNPLNIIDQVTMGAITDLTKLKELNLSGCELKSLPEGMFSRLRQLKRLDLSKNRFTSVPVVLGEAVHLLYLDLGGNLIEALDNSTALSNLTKLKELRLSGSKKLTRIADGALGGLSNLVTLHLSYNPRLTTLEDGFLVSKDQFDHELWPKITEIYLNNNNLSTIYSAYVNNWDSLTEIDFSNNPYLCDCRNQWIVDVLVPMLKGLELDQTASNMVCINPKKMKGMSFAHLNNVSMTLSCEEQDSLKQAAAPDMAILLGVMIGIFVTFPIVLIIVLLWNKGYFSRCRRTVESSSEDEETDAFESKFDNYAKTKDGRMKS